MARDADKTWRKWYPNWLESVTISLKEPSWPILIFRPLSKVIRNNFALLLLWFIAWKHLKVKDKLSHLDLKSIMAFHRPKISNIYAICRFSMPPSSANYQLTFHIISGCSSTCGRKCVPDVGGICYNLWLINGSSRTNRSQVLLKRKRWSLMIRRLRNSASRWKTGPPFGFVGSRSVWDSLSSSKATGCALEPSVITGWGCIMNHWTNRVSVCRGC